MPTTQTADLLQRKLADPGERQRLIAAYVRDTLPPDLVDAFESRLFDAPDLAADVEAEEYLRETCRTLSRDDVLVRPLAGLPPRRERRIGFALAAGLAAGALLPSLMWWRAEQRVMLAEVGVAPRAAGEAIAVFALSGVRRLETKAPVQDVAIPADASRLALQIPAPNESGPYRVRLVRDGETAPLAEAVVANEVEGYLGFAVGTAGLRGVATAQLVVDVRRGDEWVANGSYPLNFVVGAVRR